MDEGFFFKIDLDKINREIKHKQQNNSSQQQEREKALFDGSCRKSVVIGYLNYNYIKGGTVTG